MKDRLIEIMSHKLKAESLDAEYQIELILEGKNSSVNDVQALQDHLETLSISKISMQALEHMRRGFLGPKEDPKRQPIAKGAQPQKPKSPVMPAMPKVRTDEKTVKEKLKEINKSLDEQKMSNHIKQQMMEDVVKADRPRKTSLPAGPRAKNKR
jgi:hypothetical protein